MPEPGRPEAARAIWTVLPSPGASDSERRATIAHRRVAGSIRALIGGCLGILAYSFLSRAMGIAILTLSSLVLFAALVSPAVLYAGIERLIAVSSEWVKRFVTFATMVSLFYLLFLPFGKLSRRGRRDRLNRHFDADASTYWVSHRGTRDARSHRRLY